MEAKRVYELARELGVKNSVLIPFIEDLGIKVLSHMSTLDNDDVFKIRQKAKGRFFNISRMIEEYNSLSNVFSSLIKVNLYSIENEKKTESYIREDQKKDDLKPDIFEINNCDTGHTYESIFGKYIIGAKEVLIHEPYLRFQYQLQNLYELIKLIIRQNTIKSIKLRTGYDKSPKEYEFKENQIREYLSKIKESLLEFDVVFDFELIEKFHFREIRSDTGWSIDIDKGLHIYQKPDDFKSFQANMPELRYCNRFKVTISKIIYDKNEIPTLFS